MTQELKPKHPSLDDYYNLIKEFDRKGLIYNRYRELLWYQKYHGDINNNDCAKDIKFNGKALSTNSLRKGHKKKNQT